MNNKNNLKDDYLKRMMKQMPLDQPSDDFTSKIMGKIEMESVTAAVPAKAQPVIEIKYWLLIGAGLTVAAIILFGADWTFMESIFGFFNFSNVQLPEFSLNFIGLFQKMFKGIQIPNVAIIGMFAIGALFVIDRILHKKSKSNIVSLLLM